MAERVVTRSVLVAAFRASAKAATPIMGITLTAPAYAGQLLEMAHGDVRRAIALCPRISGFYEAVLKLLYQLKSEEAA